MFVTPFLRMALEEEIGHGKGQQQEPATPGSSEYEEGEGLPVMSGQEESEQSNAVSDAQAELMITEEPEESEKAEAGESEPLRGGACADVDASSPSKAEKSPPYEHSKLSIEELESGEEGPGKRKGFDRKCVVILVLLLLVIIAGAIGAVFINKFTAKVSYSFRFSNYFRDHMVLQRAPSRAVVWGYGPVPKGGDDGGDNVSVVLTVEGAGVSREYLAHVTGQVSGGVWYVVLDPITERGPFTIQAKLKGENSQTLQLSDVLVGDVWLCAGQRNMQFPVAMLEEEERQKELESVDEYGDVRLLSLWPEKEIVASDEIRDPLLKWSKPSKESLMGGSKQNGHFSALCWLYGRRLHDKLRYPVGLISATYFSSSIDDWIPPGVVETCNITVPHETSTVYKTLIRPLQSTSIYGVIWYQGENDAEHQPFRRYDCSLVAMVAAWRSAWHRATHRATDPNFPVGIVQLGAYRNESTPLSGYTDIRWQQTANYGFAPNPQLNKTFLAVAVDLPDFNHSKQPKHKSEIADRLMLGALSVAYQQKVVFSGPFPSKYATFPANQSLVLAIDAIQLDVRSSAGFEVCCAQNAQDQCTVSLVKAVYAPGREWVPAHLVTHTDQSVTLTWRGEAACEGRHVTGVRYLWQESPCAYLRCAVYDRQSGLPMAPYIKQGLVADGGFHTIQREATNHTLA